MSEELFKSLDDCIYRACIRAYTKSREPDLSAECPRHDELLIRECLDNVKYQGYLRGYIISLYTKFTDFWEYRPIAQYNILSIIF